MKRSITPCVCLLIIIILAFIVRYRGINFGFPLIVHPDEPKMVGAAINILKTGDLNPHCFLYPSLYIYMLASMYLTILKIGKLTGIFQGSSGIAITTFYFWGRMLTILLSVGTIYLTYLIGRRLFDKMTGLIATLFVSFSCLHIFNSYTVTVDSPMAFWVILSFFISILSYTDGPKLRYYLLNGIFIGFAIGTKYTAFWCALPMIYVHLCHVSFSPRKVIDKRLLLGLFMIPLAFAFTTPFSIIDYKAFIGYLKYQQRAYSLGHPGYESSSNSYGYYFQSLVQKYGATHLIMAATGITFSWLNNKRKTILLICFPFFYFLFFGAYRVHFDRNMVVLIPFLALSGAYGICAVAHYFKKGHFKNNLTKYGWLICGLLIIVMGVGIYKQTYKAMAHIRRITLPDTRWISMIWIEKNIRHGSTICREEYTPPIQSKNYKVAHVGFLGLTKYRLDYFDYIIASSEAYERFVTNEKIYPVQAQKYREIFSKYKLIKEFIPDNKKTGGPVIRIYKTQ